MALCKKYMVSGTVQGVFFRHNTMLTATDLGLTGWVQNLVDGRVELVACGDENQLDKLESWLWKGPEKAHVHDVKVSDEPLQQFSDFVIRRKK